MEAEAGDAPPFWAEPYRRRHPRRNQGGIFSIFLSPVTLIPAILVAAILASYIPSLLSPLLHILRRTLIFRSWDAFNFLLVLFAIFAGIFGRTAAPSQDDNHSNQLQQPESDYLSSKLFEIPGKADDQGVREDEIHEFNVSRELKSVEIDDEISLPSMVEEEALFSGSGGGRKEKALDLKGDRRPKESSPSIEAWFSRADGGRKREETPSGKPLPEKTAHHYGREDDVESSAPLKTIHVDTSTLIHKKYPSFTLPPPSPPPPPPPLPPSPSPVAKEKGSRQRRKDSSVASFPSFSLPPPSPPPPPLPPAPSPVVKIKRSRQRGKDSSVMSFPSFGSRKKETKEKKKGSSAEIPAPPPLPPPPSFFRNLFGNLKKEAKTERPRVHSVSIPPAPPPPTTLYPRKSTTKDATSTRTKEKTRKENADSRDSSITRPFPLPPLAPAKDQYKAYTFRRNSSGGGGWFIPSSPPPPPPPPPPPFIVVEQNTSTESKYIKNKTKLHTEYEGTVEQKQGKEEVKGEDGGGGGRSSSFCPSPDVNVKAENFIARMREGIRLEKIQSLRERREREAMKLETSGTDSTL